MDAPDSARLARRATAILGDATLSDGDALSRVVSLLAASRPRWAWTGLYLRVGDELRLGPYVGPPTEHHRIPVGVGVCGTAVAEGADQNVPDVQVVANFLACSASTRSELVVLIRYDEAIVGQFDVDSDEVAAFGPDDEQLLRTVASAAGTRCRRLAQCFRDAGINVECPPGLPAGSGGPQEVT